MDGRDSYLLEVKIVQCLGMGTIKLFLLQGLDKREMIVPDEVCR